MQNHYQEACYILHARNSFENKIFWKRIIKKPSEILLDFFLCTHSIFMDKEKGPETSYLSLFGLQNMFRKIPFLMIYHLSNFDDLIQIVFWVTPKMIFANLCKPMHNVIIIPVSVSIRIWNLWKGRGKIVKKKQKQKKTRISREKMLFRWNKSHLSQFLKYFLLLKYKK